MCDQKDTVYELMGDELSITIGKQRESRTALDSKTTQLITADLVIAGLFATAISIFEEGNLIVYMAASIAALVLSIYYCFVAYSPLPFTHGIGHKGHRRAKSIDTKRGFQHYRLRVFSKAIITNGRSNRVRVDYLQKALLASLAAPLYFLGSIISLFVTNAYIKSGYSIIYDIVFLSVLSMLVFYGKHMSKESIDAYMGDDGNGDTTYDGPSVIVKAAVKKHINEIDEELNISSDFYPALNSIVDEKLAEAALRAEDNDRSTVMAKDL